MLRAVDSRQPPQTYKNPSAVLTLKIRQAYIACMENLCSYLKASNMTQAAFAEAIRVSQPTVNRWLRGQARPTWEAAAEIERVTGGRVPVSVWAEIHSEQSPKQTATENAEAS